ncbi:MAG: hypothetical protein SO170_10645 [Butyribacter sp.]|nr:hypothetical protein [Butyribacter sp.]
MLQSRERKKPDKFQISHNRSFIKDKSEVIAELEELYQEWTR